MLSLFISQSKQSISMWKYTRLYHLHSESIMKPLCYPSVQIFFKNISSYKIDINIDNYDWVGSKVKKYDC